MKRRYLEGTWQKKNRAFSPAVITRGGTTVWIAGHGAPVDPAGNSLAGDFEAQAHQSFNNMDATLAECGASLKDIVTMTVYLIDARFGDKFIEIRRKYFEVFPASAMITIDGFAQPEMMVEIQGIAVIGDN
jgi:2-iminobutanoate/2-iminopropanoate deaminase